MKDRIDREIEAALREIVNEPARPDSALVSRIRAKARAGSGSQGLILAAAGAAMLANAAFAFLLAYRAAAWAGGGWASAAAALAGFTLAFLPCVPVLAAGDLAKIVDRKKE